MYNLQTVLLAYQSMEPAEQERFATRFGLSSAFRYETERIPWLTQKLRLHLNKVQGRDTRIPAIKKGSISPVTAASYNLQLNLPETAYSTVTLVTLMVSWGIFPEDWENQHIDKEQILANRVKECDEALALAYEAYLYTHLNTYRTKVWTDDSDLGFSFDAAADILQVSKDAQFNDSFFANLATLARVNNWNSDTASFITNPAAGHMYNRMAQLGAANAMNLQFQQLPLRFESLRVTNTAGYRWSGFLCEAGAVGVVENYTLPFRIAKEVMGGKFEISPVALPMLGHKVGLYEELGAKASSQNGAMSWVDKYAMIHSFFLLKNYNSDDTTRVSNIVRIDGSKQ